MRKENMFENLDKLILTDDDDSDVIKNLDLTAEEIEDEPKVNDTAKTEEEKKKEVKKEPTLSLADLQKIETEEEKLDDKSNTSTVESQEELIEAWAEEFKKESLLTDDDLKDFNKTLPGMVKAFQEREVRVGLEMVEDYKSQVPPIIKALLENWEENVPLDELINIKSNQMRYSGIDEKELEEKPETQKVVVAEYLRKTTKFSESKITKEVERLQDLDELKDEAKDGLKELKKFEAEAEDTLKKETKKQQEKRREDNQKVISEYNKIAKSIKEVIPGIKIDDKTVEKMLKHTIDPVAIDGNGNQISYIQTLRNENPYEFDLKLNYIMEITKGLTDFSKITTVATTKATADIFNKLDEKRPKASKDGLGQSKEKKSIMDYMKMPVNKKLN